MGSDFSSQRTQAPGSIMKSCIGPTIFTGGPFKIGNHNRAEAAERKTMLPRSGNPAQVSHCNREAPSFSLAQYCLCRTVLHVMSRGPTKQEARRLTRRVWRANQRRRLSLVWDVGSVTDSHEERLARVRHVVQEEGRLWPTLA